MSLGLFSLFWLIPNMLRLEEKSRQTYREENAARVCVSFGNRVNKMPEYIVPALFDCLG